MTTPTIVTNAQIAEAARVLGLDPDRHRQCMRIVIEPGQVTVTYHRLNEAGRPFLAGAEVATETLTIALAETTS